MQILPSPNVIRGLAEFKQSKGTGKFEIDYKQRTNEFIDSSSGPSVNGNKALIYYVLPK